MEQKEQLQQHRELLNQSLADERAFTEKNVEAKAAYDIYTICVADQQLQVTQNEHQLDQLIDKLQDSLSEAFGSLKKYEILLERKQAKELKEIDAKEQKELATPRDLTHLAGRCEAREFG